MINVTVWWENSVKTAADDVLEVYPNGINECLKDFLNTDESINATSVSLDDESFGLPDELLNNTDVLMWWGHTRHQNVPDELVEKIYNRVMCGMGIIFLHSAHFSKPFKRLMGTTCSLKWREGDRERVWNILPSHPIAKNIPDYFELGEEEMYGERFDIPKPDEIVFMGWFAGGELFRSGCTWQRGLGKVFYFQPGHETNPTYHNKYVQQILLNAVKWANPQITADEIKCPHFPSLEK